MLFHRPLPGPATGAVAGNSGAATIAMITAMIITAISSTMPIAVITESSEKTMSSNAIWMITLAKEG